VPVSVMVPPFAGPAVAGGVRGPGQALLVQRAVSRHPFGHGFLSRCACDRWPLIRPSSGRRKAVTERGRNVMFPACEGHDGWPRSTAFWTGHATLQVGSAVFGRAVGWGRARTSRRRGCAVPAADCPRGAGGQQSRDLVSVEAGLAQNLLAVLAQARRQAA